MECWEATAVWFISEDKLDIRIRNYTASDFEDLYSIYKKAFSEEPWDEYKKCPSCGINYGIKEIVDGAVKCKRCKNNVSLTDYWSKEDVDKDLLYA